MTMTMNRRMVVPLAGVCLVLMISQIIALNINWAYDDRENYLGPEKWYTRYAECNHERQSPVDISYESHSNDWSAGVKPHLTTFGCRKFQWWNDGDYYTGLKWIYARTADDICTANGFADDAFELTHIDVHTPSEHSVNGELKDGELQFIYTANGGKRMMAISVFLKLGDPDKTVDEYLFVKELLDGLPADPDSASTHGYVNLGVSYEAFINSEYRNWFNYQGSSTIPPCSENFDWWISPDAAIIEQSQLDAIKIRHNKMYRATNSANNRPVQDKHGREIRPLPHNWGYTSLRGNIHPSYWYEVYPKCAADLQSPIDIPYLTANNELKKQNEFKPDLIWDCITFDYHEDTSMYWVPTTPCMTKGEQYELMEIRLHTPSEHRINGTEYDSELQFINKMNGGLDMIVISVFLNSKSGIPNQFVDKLLSPSGGVTSLDKKINEFVLQTDASNANTAQWFNYYGSLTTPPCSDHTQWWIRSEAIAISSLQLDKMQFIHNQLKRTDSGKNNRPLQPLQGREIKPFNYSWAYTDVDGNFGPDSWAIKYPLCDGHAQSPIDIPYTDSLANFPATPHPKITTLAGCDSFTWHNDPSDTQLQLSLNRPDGQTVTCTAKGSADAEFDLKDIYLHTPSEHKVNKKAYDGEIQFIHSLDGGSKLIYIGIFLSVSGTDDDPFIQQIIEGVSDSTTGPITLDKYKDFLGASERLWFNYHGSQTKPPCNEIVDWWISPVAVNITLTQLEWIKAKHLKMYKTNLSKNNRPTQAIEGREIRPLLAQWAYHDHDGGIDPKFWGNKYERCSSNQQSPINIPYTGASSELGAIMPHLTVVQCYNFEWKYERKSTQIVWEYRPAFDDQCFAQGRGDFNYDLDHIAMHYPAEHSINGKVFDAEIKFVHKANHGRDVMVVLILLEVVTKIPNNSYIEQLLDALGDGYSTTKGDLKLSQSHRDFVNANERKWFNYQGSMTYPPCLENVDWWISPEATGITQAQLDLLIAKNSILVRVDDSANNRQFQSLSGREIRPLNHQWAYSEMNGGLGPEYWSIDYPICGLQKQSPIDFHYDNLDGNNIAPVLSASGCTYFEWFNDPKDTALKWELQVTEHTCTAKGRSDTEFEFVGFEIHSPAEHAMNGRIYDGEIQFIHSSHGGSEFMIVSVLLELSSVENTFLEEIINSFTSGRHGFVTYSTSYVDFIDPDKTQSQPWFNYQGSLTTPPCSENVDWWVAPIPKKISKSQLEFIVSKQAAFIRTSKWKNNRPLQARNGREIRPLSYSWGYSDWNGNLAPKFWHLSHQACGNALQSPIDIPYISTYDSLPEINPEVAATSCNSFEWHNDPETTNLKWRSNQEDGKCRAKGEEDLYFNLDHFTMHSPSEHRINMNSFDAEVQFVHSAHGGSQLLIISVLLEISDADGSEDPFIKELFDGIGSEMIGNVTLSAAYQTFIGATEKKWYNYHGSQTSPPCTENVEWWVSAKAAVISHDQYDFLIHKQAEFTRTYDSQNNRPVQPLNGRKIRPFEVRYAYSSTNGALAPEFWSKIYPKCALHDQSPIDIPWTGPLDDLEKIYPLKNVTKCQKFKWEKTEESTYLKWSNIPEAGDECIAVGYASSIFKLKHLQIHTPSEHRLNGKIFDGEIQIVHTEANGANKKLSLGIVLEVDPEASDNEFLKELFDNLIQYPGAKSGTITLSKEYDKFLTFTDYHWFNYHGSESAPPCSEIVDWWVTAEPLIISKKQHEFMLYESSSFIRTNDGKNNRPIQPRNGRRIRPLNSEYSYHQIDGALAPEHWKLKYPKCGESMQSPIDIPYSMDVKNLEYILPEIHVKGCLDFEWFNDPSYTNLKWVHKQTAGDSCKAKGRASNEYSLSHFIIHTPSEHKVNGRSYDAELQFIHHAHDESEFMVISILIDVYGINEDPFLKEIISKIGEGKHAPVNFYNHYEDFIAADKRHWFNYRGSLTSPPCTEMVDWWVAPDPVHLTAQQMELLIAKQLAFPRADRSKNNRPIQPTNGRLIRPLVHSWAYHEQNGGLEPAYWSNDYPMCGLSRQSPINIPYSANLDDLEYKDKIFPILEVFGCMKFEWFNDPSTTELSWAHAFEERDSCKAKGKSGNEFDLQNIVIHAPSEHQLGDRSFDAEIQFVHSAGGGSSLMNIGIFLEVVDGEKNEFLQELLDGIADGTHGFMKLTRRYKDFIYGGQKMTRKWFNYQGSRTQPPCEEIVDWWIAARPVAVSRNQYDFLIAKHLAFARTNKWRNNRPIQDLNGRQIRPLTFEWGYHNDNGVMPPERWGIEYPHCNHKMQSPIDIPYTGTLSILPDIKPLLQLEAEKCNEFEWHNDPHHTDLKWTVTNEDAKKSCKVTGRADYEFGLAQFHIHSPSEHKINGKHFDAEIHFVHSARDEAQLVVLGILLELSSTADDNAFVKELLDKIGSGKTGNIALDNSYETFIDAANRKWFNYRGSLTTPPCDEKVDWWVSPEPVAITKKDLDRILSKLLSMERTDKGHNNRPIQAINGRTIRPLHHKWAYHDRDGAIGPHLWYKSYHRCSGEAQSPIDIPYSGHTSSLTGIRPVLPATSGCKNFKWQNSPHHSDLKWTIKSASGDSCRAKGKADMQFDLLQFHIHAPSEHKIHHKQFDAEVHFVHSARGGKELMVIGILLEVSGTTDNAFLYELFDNVVFGIEEGDVTLTNAYQDFISAEKRKWFNYQGSLTTPPCSEIVDWWLSPDPVPISEHQLDFILSKQLGMEKTDYGHNNRPTQAINGREIRPLSNVWAYSEKEGAIAPQRWHEKYLDCGFDHQSPLDIPYDRAIADIPDFSFHLEVIGCKEYEWHNHESQTQLTWTSVRNAGESCTIRGLRPDKYDLLHIDMKAPSEHKINHKQYHAEIQFVFTGHGGTEMVAAAMFLEASDTDDNPFIQALFDGIDEKANGKVVLNESYENFISAEERKWFNYDGSLTEPPCSEIVDWWVSPEPVHISIRQYDFLISMQLAYIRTDYSKNNRPVQAANGREIRPLSNEWAYHEKNGLRGPDNWFTNYPACADEHQSPLDIPITTTLESLKRIKPDLTHELEWEMDYLACTHFVWHNNPSQTDLQWQYKHMVNETCAVQGKNKDHIFDLLQFHIHAPSDHKIGGHLFDAEVHFVHTRDGGKQLLVVAILLEIGGNQDNPFLQELFGEIGNGLNGDIQLKYNTISDFIDAGSRPWLNYDGSLTTPPCLENVEWWISPQAIIVSQKQLDYIIAKQISYPLTDSAKNNRPVQPINGREIRPLDHSWAYHHHDGSLPPEHWKDEYASCGGTRQSPIDIAYTGSISDLPTIAPTLTVAGCKHFEYKNPSDSTELKWSLSTQPGDSCKAKGKADHDYDLLQFHMHAPSEHEVNGHLYDAEVHFVHKLDNGTALMVVGILLEVYGTADDDFIKDIFDNIPDNADGHVTLSKAYQTFINAPGRKWFNYEGSLTQPPCSETVDWWLSPEPVHITEAQLDILISKQEAFVRTDNSKNNRPVQPVNGREIRPLPHKWGYHEKNGLVDAEHWHVLDQGKSCAVHVQSPIDIPYPGDVSELPKIWPVVACGGLNLEYSEDYENHLFLKWTPQDGETSCKSRGRENNEVFTLSEIALHTPSEHRRNGISFDAEIHFLFSDREENPTDLPSNTFFETDNFNMQQNQAAADSHASGDSHASSSSTDSHTPDSGDHRRLAATTKDTGGSHAQSTTNGNANETPYTYVSPEQLGISVFLEIHEKAEDSPFLEELLSSDGGSAKMQNLTEFLHENSKHWFTYVGSKTSPNCDDNVEWWIMAETIWVSRSQYDSIISKHAAMARVEKAKNNRPLQPIWAVESSHIYPLPKLTDDNDYHSEEYAAEGGGATIGWFALVFFVASVIVVGFVLFIKRNQNIATLNKYTIHPSSEEGVVSKE